MSWADIDDPTPDRVLEALSGAVVAHARGIFARDPALQTVLLVVAQYWADSARDEVHDEWLYSTDDAVPWPHDCDHASGGADPYHCQWCFKWGDDDAGRVDFWLPTSDPIKHGIEPFCLEGASQWMTTADAFLPFMIVRRGVDSVDFVGQLQRPWMRPDLLHIDVPPPDLAPLFAEVYRRPDDDGPRHVLADCLQAAGDPRGTFIALQLQRRPTPKMQAEIDRLLMAHRNRWLGDLLQVASPARCRFTRGFASAIALGPAPIEAFEAVAGSPAWGAVDTVAFPDLDEPPDWPILLSFRHVRRIDAPEDALDQMAEAGGEWAASALHCTGIGGVDALSQLALPNLRHLMLEYPRPGDLAQLRRRPWWGQLTHLDLAAADPVASFVAAIGLTTAAIRVVKPYASLLIERVGSTTARLRATAHQRTSVDELLDQLRGALPTGWQVDTGPPLTPKTHLALQRSFWTILPD